VYSHIQGWL